MTMLDEGRARAQLANKARVPVDQVTKMAIWGNHSATQWPDFYHAQINGRPATKVIADDIWLQGKFVETVQKRGAAIIAARGPPRRPRRPRPLWIRFIVSPMRVPRKSIFLSLSAPKGSMEWDEGLIFSYPCRVENGQLFVVQGIEQTPYGQEKFDLTHRELQSEREMVKKAGLVES